MKTVIKTVKTTIIAKGDNNLNYNYVEVKNSDEEAIKKMSALASTIVKEYYEPLLGKEQNDYMIDKFQSVDGVKKQLEEGYKYYFVRDIDDKSLGFISFCSRKTDLYLSKFYLHKDFRGKGISKDMLKFVIEEAKELGLPSIVLNVNKYNDLAISAYERLGFTRIGEEKNDIDHGYYMDDYVYTYLID